MRIRQWFLPLLLMLGIAFTGSAVRADKPEKPGKETGKSDKASETDTIEKTALPIIESEHGSLQIGLVIQTGFEVLPNQVEGQRNSFTLNRARLRLNGHLVTKNLTYLFEGDAINGIGPAVRHGAPGSEVIPEDGREDVPFLLDARITWRIPKLGMTFSIGRFIPKWGITMPEKISRLGAISYPLYVHGSKGSLGTFRNIGVEAEFEMSSFLKAGGGVFNGGKNSWLDDNDRKDMLVHFTLTPVAGLEIRAASLFKFPEIIDGVREDATEIEKGNETHIVPILEARYQDYGLDLMAGVATGVIFRYEDDTRDDHEAFGLMAHAGYLLIGDWFQLMGRLEWWEPNNEIKEDDQLRVTVGPQLFITSIYAQININYIHDIYGGKQAMCENYLNLSACEEPDLAPEAQNNAAAVVIQFVLDL